MTIHSDGSNYHPHNQNNSPHFWGNNQPMWIYDPETLRVLDVNNAALRIYGYTRTEFLALYVPVLYQDDQPQLGSYFDQHFLTNHFEGNWQHRTKNGQTVNVHETSEVIQDEQRRTIRVSAQPMLPESPRDQNHEDWFTALFKCSPEAIIICAATGYIVMANQKAEEIFGYSKDEFEGLALETLIPERFRERHHQHFINFSDAVYSRPMGTGMELYGLAKNQQEFPIEVGLSSMVVQNQRYMLATITDITRRKQIDDQVKMLSQLMQDEVEKQRELVELKERFISMVTHEFRTPLTVILSSASLLDSYRKKMSDEKQSHHIKRIVGQVHNMNDLLEDVLTISKARAGIIEFDPQPLNLTDLCYQIVEEMRISDQHAHHIRFMNDPIASVQMDERVIRHILTNLLSNAIKYSEQGTDIEVSIRSENETHVTLVVRDYGIGIPSEDMESLFEPFHRAHNVRHIAGTGLGLPIVKHNVEMHGGTIRCSSKEGEGTVFTVVLPKRS